MKFAHVSICAFALFGGASAAVAMPNDPDATPGGERFCRQYAASTADVVSEALKRKPGCLDYGRGVHANVQMHYEWCMRTPRTEVLGAANHIRDLAGRCAGPKPKVAGIDWVRSSGGAVDARAPAVGRDTNGAPLFVCSADVGGVGQPGKIRPGFSGCNFGYGGRELTAKTYSVMIGRPRWARASGGSVPQGALQAGSEKDGRALFVCRTAFNGSLQIGKVRPGFAGCNFGYGGREMTGNPYEVLY